MKWQLDNLRKVLHRANTTPAPADPYGQPTGAAPPAPMPGMAPQGMPPQGMPMDPSAMGGAPPMDPSMMGGAPPQGMPMDPSMMGGAPPMDPNAMGGAPPQGMPMDPSMMGGAPPQGMPMDPSAMGGAPPVMGDGAPPPPDPLQQIAQVVRDEVEKIVAPLKKELAQIGKRLDEFDDFDTAALNEEPDSQEIEPPEGEQDEAPPASPEDDAKRKQSIFHRVFDKVTQ